MYSKALLLSLIVFCGPALANHDGTIRSESKPVENFLWRCQIQLKLAEGSGLVTSGSFDTRSAKNGEVIVRLSTGEDTYAALKIDASNSVSPRIVSMRVFQEVGETRRPVNVANFKFESALRDNQPVLRFGADVKAAVAMSTWSHNMNAIVFVCTPKAYAELDSIGYFLGDEPKKRFEALRKWNRKALDEATITNSLYLVANTDPDTSVSKAADRIIHYNRGLNRKNKLDRLEYFRTQTLPDEYQGIHKAMIKLRTPFDGCSAIAISPKFVLSAGHCFRGERGPIEAFVFDGLGNYKKKTLRVRMFVRNPRGADFSILEIEGDEFRDFVPLESIDEYTENAQTQYFVPGFPDKGPDLGIDPGDLMISRTKNIGNESAFDFAERSKQSSIPARHGDYSSAHKMLSMDAAVWDGNSGSPIVKTYKTPNGIKRSVVGVVVGANSRDRVSSQSTRGHGVKQVLELVRGTDPGLAKELGADKGEASSPEEIFDVPHPYQLAFVKGQFKNFRLESKKISNVAIVDMTFDVPCVFKDVTFTLVQLSDVDFSRCEFVNVTFEKSAYSTTVKWPKGYIPNAKSNLGPLSPSNQPKAPGSIKTVEGKDLSGIHISLMFNLSGVAFKDSDLSHSTIEAETDQTTFERVKVTDSSLREAPESIRNLIGEEREQRRGQAASEKLKASIQFSDDLEFSSGARLWTPEQKTRIESYLRSIEKQFPRFVADLQGIQINLRRVDAVSTAEHGPVSNAFTSLVYHRAETLPVSTNVDILLSDRVLEGNTELNGVPKLFLTLLHELSHVRDRQKTWQESAMESFESPKPDGLNTAWEQFIALKKAGKDEEAYKLSYEFATKHGMPSVYAMKEASDETRAELIAFGALDPSFKNYASEATLKSVNAILGKQ